MSDINLLTEIRNITAKMEANRIGLALKPFKDTYSLNRANEEYLNWIIRLENTLAQITDSKIQKLAADYVDTRLLVIKDKAKLISQPPIIKERYKLSFISLEKTGKNLMNKAKNIANTINGLIVD